MPPPEPASLPDDAKAIIDFARREYRLAGAKEEAMRIEFGFGSTTFYRKLWDLLDDPAALAYDPVTLHRYQRIIRRGNQMRAPGLAHLRND